jgi:hypothetical protein
MKIEGQAEQDFSPKEFAGTDAALDMPQQLP